MTAPRVVMLSFWRNDVSRNLTARAAHLLDKTYPALEWVWIVGDSTDGTAEALNDLRVHGAAGMPICLVDLGDTGLPGDDPDRRLRRLSRTAQAGLACVTLGDAVVVLHESDIVSPPDVIERLLAVPGDVVGAWPVLGDGGLFYDTWAYRGLDGQHFTNGAPYHDAYQAAAPFELASVGTVWRFPAAAVARGLRCTTGACVELCAGLRMQGYRIWCDPGLTVVQPLALWTPQGFPAEVAYGRA